MTWPVSEFCHFGNHTRSLTRNSAVADKPRDAFVQMLWRGWPPKTCPSPYVLPCQIRLFCVKLCGHNYSRAPKLGSAETPLSSGGRRTWLTPRYTLLPNMCYHVKFGSSASKGVCINRRKPSSKLGCAWAPPPCGRGVADPQEIRHSPHVLFCRIWLFYVKRYERY